MYNARYILHLTIRFNPGIPPFHCPRCFPNQGGSNIFTGLEDGAHKWSRSASDDYHVTPTSLLTTMILRRGILSGRMGSTIVPKTVFYRPHSTRRRAAIILRPFRARILRPQLTWGTRSPNRLAAIFIL